MEFPYKFPKTRLCNDNFKKLYLLFRIFFAFRGEVIDGAKNRWKFSHPLLQVRKNEEEEDPKRRRKIVEEEEPREEEENPFHEGIVGGVRIE